jgi:hypothetical protein
MMELSLSEYNLLTNDDISEILLRVHDSDVCRGVQSEMKYQVIIFDMDGTLLNTLDDLYNAVNYVLLKFGYPLRTREEVRSFVGNGVQRLVDFAIPNGQNNPHRINLELFQTNMIPR